MRKLALFAGGFCTAAFVFVCGLTAKTALLAAAVLAVGVLFTAVLRRRPAICAALILLGASVGLLWCAADWQRNVRPLQAYDGKTIAISAEAKSESRSTAYGTSTLVELELGERRYSAVLYGEATLHPGDRTYGTARLRQAGTGVGDDDLYYGARGVSLLASMRDGAKVDRAATVPFRYWPAAFCGRLKESIRTVLPPESAAYEVALLNGDASGLSEAFENQMGLVGMKHIVSVSGMHIAILMGVVLLLMGYRRRLAALIGLPLIWFFALSVGMSASIVRAAVMQSFLILAPIVRRENDPPTTILTALMLILLPNPRAIVDVGLQLSFTSVAGILLFSGPMFKGVWNLPAVRRLRNSSRVLRPVVKVVLAQAVASVSVIPLTLPLCVLYFKMYSLVSPLSSALVVSVIPACFSLGLFAALAGIFSPTIGRIIAWPADVLVRYCMWMTRRLAAIPSAAVSSANPYMLVFLLGIYGMTTYLLVARKKCRPAVLVGCITGLFSVCLILSSLEYDRATVSVTMLDVGQGECVYVASRGCAGLYDCGGNDGNAGETAARFLQSIGRSRLDFLALSHYDEDHVGGVVQLLSRIRVDVLYLPALADKENIQKTILEAAVWNGCQTVFVQTDLRLLFGGGVTELYAPVSGTGSNDSSVAARWTVGDFDVLLTGDMGKSAEHRLLQTQDLHGIEVLVAGHHGASGSTGEELLQTAKPGIVLVSVGDNSYGHPSNEALERFAACGAVVYRTDQCGDITVRR